MDRDRERDVRVHGDFVGGDVITTERIHSGGGMVIGRGTKAAVMQQTITTLIEESSEALSPNFEDLVAQVDESNLSSNSKEQMHSNLEDLRSEVEQGETGDVKNTRQWLKEISGTMPDLNQPLWTWLEGTEHVSTPIKIVARKMLT